MSDSTHPAPPTEASSGGWRFTRWLLAGAAALITLVVLIYAVVDWRGKRAWEAYKAQWAGKGGLPDFAAFIPPPAPDDQNFAMTPFLAPLFDFNPLPLLPGQSHWRDTNGQQRAMTAFSSVFNGSSPQQGPYLWRRGRVTDLPEWVKSWRQRRTKDKTAPKEADSALPTDRNAAAAAILSQLEQIRPVLDELRQASHRPRSRFNIRYDESDPWSILLPHLAVLKGACGALELRASAELASGNATAAADDVGLIFYLSSTMKDEPFVITHLVRLVMIDYAVQDIWEGLASRQWTDQQLRAFQNQLGELTVLRDLQRTLNAERAADNLTFELLRTHRDRERFFSDITGAGDSQAFLFLLAPRGWSYQEQVVCNQLFDKFITSGFNPESQEVSPAIIESNSAAMSHEFQTTPLRLAWNHLVMARLLLPELGKTLQKSALAQNAIDEANVACALERCRIANGKYPDSLDALWPGFIQSLPHDVCTGQPLKYRLTQDGGFVLYSLGWNEKDDSGTVSLTKSVSASMPGTWHPDEGDWVWQYPTKEP